MITAISSLIAFNTLRKDGFFPQPSPPLFAGEIREREQGCDLSTACRSPIKGFHRVTLFMYSAVLHATEFFE